jgi:hypothetical protein
MEVARALLAAGAAVMPRDKEGVTPLHCSVKCKDDAVAYLLIRRGASLWEQDARGVSAYAVAIKHNILDGASGTLSEGAARSVVGAGVDADARGGVPSRQRSITDFFSQHIGEAGTPQSAPPTLSAVVGVGAAVGSSSPVNHAFALRIPDAAHAISMQSMFAALHTPWNYAMLRDVWIGGRCREMAISFFVVMARVEAVHGFTTPLELMLKILSHTTGVDFVPSPGGGSAGAQAGAVYSTSPPRAITFA